LSDFASIHFNQQQTFFLRQANFVWGEILVSKIDYLLESSLVLEFRSLGKTEEKLFDSFRLGCFTINTKIEL
jgi:hypothetical protein